MLEHAWRDPYGKNIEKLPENQLGMFALLLISSRMHIQLQIYTEHVKVNTLTDV